MDMWCLVVRGGFNQWTCGAWLSGVGLTSGHVVLGCQGGFNQWTCGAWLSGVGLTSGHVLLGCQGRV